MPVMVISLLAYSTSPTELIPALSAILAIIDSTKEESLTYSANFRESYTNLARERAISSCMVSNNEYNSAPVSAIIIMSESTRASYTSSTPSCGESLSMH